MTKQDMVSFISESTGLKQDDVYVVTQNVMRYIKMCIEHGDDVYLRGFGTFMRKKRKAKKARDIKANKSVDVPEHYVPFFKPSKKFKEVLK